MTKNFTEVELLEIISCADELITALDGTNEDLHRDNSTKMCETWDHLNDHLAPPAVVKALAQELLAARMNHPDSLYTPMLRNIEDRK